MARLAIFIDGGYVDALARDEFSVRVDYDKFVEELVNSVSAKTAETLDLLRTYYYHCLPYQSSPPTQEEVEQFAGRRRFFQALSRLDRFQVREGRLTFRGHDSQGKPIFQQKRTDLLLGLDFALISGKHQITHAALIAGDSDFIPAVDVAKQEGIVVCLFHGPLKNSRGQSTYAQELWDAADVRFEISQDLMNRVAR